MMSQKLADGGDVDAPSPALRRGACPTLLEPMQTGDGLLARLRPAAGLFSIEQFMHLAAATERHGNGVLEITARGSLQIRGLEKHSVSQLASELDAVGISVPDGPSIELSPLHGVAPGEIGNPAEIEVLLRETLASEFYSPLLAPKLSILIDGGGSHGLASISGDIRVVAVSPGIWQVAINGDGRRALPVVIGSADEAVQCVGDLLKMLLSLGRHKRCRDLDLSRLRAAFPSMAALNLAAVPDEVHLIGTLTLDDGTAVASLRPRFGQMRANSITAFLGLAKALGATQVRLGPGRTLLLTGLPARSAPAILELASNYGLSPNDQDPSAHVVACAGAGACASGHYNTKTLAETVVETANELLDGSMIVHLSGCSKGCAYQRRALTLVGSPDGYRLILDGTPVDAPDAQIAGGDIESAIEKLARLIRTERLAGESATACLRRVGRSIVTRALRQE